jgi:hypothetical protein
VLALVEDHMKALGRRHGMDCRRRSWGGETESLDLLHDGRKVFSFQISQRTLYLDHPVYPDLADPPDEIHSKSSDFSSKSAR